MPNPNILFSVNKSKDYTLNIYAYAYTYVYCIYVYIYTSTHVYVCIVLNGLNNEVKNQDLCKEIKVSILLLFSQLRTVL